MKKILISISILLFSLNSFSQAMVTSTGIAIQGIAKNGSSQAITSQSVPIVVELYYTVNSTNYSITTQSGTVNTDAYGIFAYVLNIDNSKFLTISNTEAYIKISANGIVFANEKLQAVPYTIFAQNGVPTGTIMPFGGDAIPAGWLLADGSTIPSDDYYKPLRDLVGSTLPNLNGIFLRGTGTRTGTTYVGPSLKSIQTDVVRNHIHSISISGETTTTDGNHTHGGRYDRGGSTTLTWTNQLDGANDGNERWSIDNWTSSNGDHSHTLSGSGTSTTQTGGADETRPVNYGVKYLIKI